MKVSDFDFHLPEDLIAKYPLKNRTDSRLLCLEKNGEIAHRHFSNLPDLLTSKDLLVFNNTKVIPARLYGCKETGGKVEILVERALSKFQVLAHIKASKAPRVGSGLVLAGKLDVIVQGRQGALFILDFGQVDALAQIEAIGSMPLPPYMDRAAEDLDESRYQTVYAKEKGAVAAPTAGLHFDEVLLNQLRSQGVSFAEVTLHIGAGTFQPVRVDDVHDHHMHHEWISVNEAVCEKVRETKRKGGRVIAVGTTSVRSLESAALNVRRSEEFVASFEGETDIFIYPGKSFKVVDAMITNFHLPKSTLLMLVSAFSGRNHILKAYQEAVAEQYRFFSYGDAMLLI